MNAIQREMAALQMDEAEKSRRIDSLQYQIGELERADLKEGEDEALNARRSVLRNAGRLIEAVEGACQSLSGDDEREGAVALIMEAEQSLASASAISEEMADLRGKAAELRYAADDLAELVRDLRDRFDVAPGELDEVEGRLDVIYRLRKKYGDTVSDMLSYLERCRRELDEIQFASDTLAVWRKAGPSA